jgi:hypothetical protein
MAIMRSVATIINPLINGRRTACWHGSLKRFKVHILRLAKKFSLGTARRRTRALFIKSLLLLNVRSRTPLLLGKAQNEAFSPFNMLELLLYVEMLLAKKGVCILSPSYCHCIWCSASRYNGYNKYTARKEGKESYRCTYSHTEKL